MDILFIVGDSQNKYNSGMPYNESNLKEYQEKLSEYINESRKYRNYLPPPEISHHDELVEWYSITENKLNRQNQSALLRQKFQDLHDAYQKLLSPTDNDCL